jgi:hypothetical protein
MGHRALGATMSLALLALATAVAFAGYSRTYPRWWEAAISLAVLSGIFPMILAVNTRIVPVFSRRDWVSATLVRLMVVCALTGGWVVFAGRVEGQKAAIVAGSAFSLAAGLLFFVNLGQLFRGKPVRPGPPLPFPEQAQADQVAIGFTRLSAIWLLVGLTTGLVVAIHTPKTGRWELVWAHAMLVGFALSMASGVTYHVLPRWTSGRWRSIRALKAHFYVTLVALPLMVLALAIDSQVLFHMSGPLQAAVIALWIGNCLPFIRRLPRLTAIGVGAAVLALAIGIGLGMSFAVTPANGALLRPVHAELNVFGWAALLITGVTYYLAPRFAGSPLRWPHLAPLQLGLTIGGLALSVALIWLRLEGHDAGELVGVAHLACAAGIGLMGVMVAGTFASKPRPLAVPLQMMKPPVIR